MVFEGGAFGRQLDLNEVMRVKLVALKREEERPELSSLSSRWGHSEKSATYKPIRRLFMWTQPCWKLDLRLPAPRLRKHTFIVLSPQLVGICCSSPQKPTCQANSLQMCRSLQPALAAEESCVGNKPQALTGRLSTVGQRVSMWWGSEFFSPLMREATGGSGIPGPEPCGSCMSSRDLGLLGIPGSQKSRSGDPSQAPV